MFRAEEMEMTISDIRISSTAYFNLHILDDFRSIRRPLVIICPGGGYFFCNPREAEPIAAAFNLKGFNTAVLFYTTEEGSRYPKQLQELAFTIDWLRHNAEKYGIIEDEIYVCGFSAGGHLAASLGVMFNKERQIMHFDCRPDAIILCYAVTVSGKFENKRTLDNICGEDQRLRSWNNLPERIDSDTPPCFIWHTGEDKAVPVENALLFASGLRRNNVPFELHVFEKGPHALSLAVESTAQNEDEINRHASSWFGLCISWLNNKMR